MVERKWQFVVSNSSELLGVSSGDEPRRASPVATKQRIMEAAARLWALDGYHGVGIEELSNAVGLQRGSLYYHITSKEDLLLDILKSSMTRLLDRSRPCLAITDTKLRLKSLSRVLMADIAKYRSEWIVFFCDSKALSPAGRGAVLALRKDYENLWESALEYGQASGDVKRFDPILLKGVLGMHNYAFVWLDASGRLEPEEVADEFIELLYNGLQGRSRAT